MQGHPLFSNLNGAARDKIIASIIGGAIGDCLGGPYEGRPTPVDLDDDAPWRLSDDTLLTIATCEAIIDRGGPEPDAIAERFASIYNSGSLTGLGASTRKALEELSHGGHWALVGRK